MNRFHHRQSVFVQRHQKSLAVLLNKLLLDDKRHRLGHAFPIFVFFFVYAQPEQYLAFSAVSDLGFAYPHKGIAVFLAQKAGQPGCGCIVDNNVHDDSLAGCRLFLHKQGASRGKSRP